MNNKQNNELGLIDILQIMGQWVVNFFKKLSEWFLHIVFFGIKKWKVLLIVTILAFGYSFFSYKSQSSEYEANMLIRSNAVETPEMMIFLNKYSNLINNSLLPEDNIKEQIALNNKQRGAICSFKAFYCIDKDRDGIADRVDINQKLSSADEELDSVNLSIKVQVKDINILPEISKSLMFYLNNTPYIKEMNKAQKAQVRNRKAFIQNEINLIDTLQRTTYADAKIDGAPIREGSNYFVYNKEILVYDDKVKLLKVHEALDKILIVHNEPITIINDFVISQQAINTFTNIASKNVILSIIIAYLILFAGFIYNKVKDQYLD